MNRLAVVVVNWNGIDDTLKCFSSLLSQTLSDFTIVIVDNNSGSKDKTELKKLEKKHPKKLVVLYNNENKGFTGGVNTGISWALAQNCDGIALFNNDAVADKNWLKTLVKSSEETIGITTGLLILSDKKTIDSTGEQFSTWGLPFPRNRGDTKELAPPGELTFGATGGASLYRAELFKEVGLFDDVLFAYYEDTDISFRAQLAGWKIKYEPSAIAYHKQGATTKRMPSGFAVTQTFKNLPVVVLKNIPRELLLSVGVRFTLAYVLMFANAVKNGQGIAALRGWLWSTGLLVHTLRERHHIQASKKVSTAYIKSLLWPDLPPNQTGLRKLRKRFTGKS